MPSDSDGFEAPPDSACGRPLPDAESAEMFYGAESDEPLSPLEEAIVAHEAELLAINGVMGIGIGDGDLGNDAIIVYVGNIRDAKQLPTALDGFIVQCVVTGEIDAY